jgi:FkbM family methyltransferase
MKWRFTQVLPSSLARWLSRQYGRTSFSQEGEDLILDRLFEGQKTGFYVDVGAHHPIRFSNTHRFYRRGWHGINIEPDPEAIELLQRRRKRDTNVACGVADREGRLTYFIFNEPALNSFDKALSEQRQNRQFRILRTKEIAVRRLSDILHDFMPASVHIDFMSVDVEGYDLQVLKSNDWSRFRPTCVLVEACAFNLGNPGADPIHTFLGQQDYELFAKTFNTVFYLNKGVNRAGRPERPEDRSR